jgi:hypothetical protein
MTKTTTEVCGNTIANTLMARPTSRVDRREKCRWRDIRNTLTP